MAVDRQRGAEPKIEDWDECGLGIALATTRYGSSTLYKPLHHHSAAAMIVPSTMATVNPMTVASTVANV